MAHPNLKYLREGSLPHMFCPGCGAGQILNYFIYAIDDLKLDLDKLVTIGGVGCMSRAPAYLNTSAIHGIHGRNLPFATGIKLTNPELTVVILMGDGGTAAIGGNHLIQAARRNLDVTVIVDNNGSYAMTGGQCAPTTPISANSSTSPYGNSDPPFNLPLLAASCGAVYVARWTALHIRRLTRSMQEALEKPGFSFVEIIAPCSTLYARRNKLGTGLDLMKFYHDNSEIKHSADLNTINIAFQNKIVVGKFVDEEKPTFIDNWNENLKHKLGDKFVPYGSDKSQIRAAS